MLNKPNIKVLSVCYSDSGGGAANAALRIHRGVNSLHDGVESTMFVKEKSTDDSSVRALSDFLPQNVFYQAGDWVASKVKNKIQHARWNRYPNREPLYMSDLRSTRLGGALEKLDFDVLHLHWINKRFVSLEELPKDKPIIWTLHDSWPFTGVCHVPYDCRGYEQQCGCCPMLHSKDPSDLSHEVWSNKRKLLEGLNLHIVTPSRWLADCARNSSLFNGFDVRVIPNCLDTEYFCPGDRVAACALLGLNPEKRYILYGAVNALTDPNKGFFYLRDAIERNSWPEDVELLIIGASREITLRNMPTHTLGYIGGDSLLAAYRAASVMVVPSLSENLSCAIMESLSCGIPVCCFNIGGNADMVEHQRCGYLATEKDSVDLASGIQWILENKVSNVLGAHARASVLKKYSVIAVSKQYTMFYQEISYK